MLVQVIDYSTQPQAKATRIEVPRTVASIPRVKVPEYVPRKTKRQKTVEREARKVQNRKRWHELHVVELTTTKRLLFKALRLLRQNKIKLTPEMAEALAHHEKWRPGRVGGRRYKKIHKFETG